MAIAGRAPRRDTGRRLRARRRIWLYFAVGLVAIIGSASISLVPLLAGHSEMRQVADVDLTLLHVARLGPALAQFQVFAEPRMAKLAPASPAEFATAASLAQAVGPLAAVVANDLATTRLPSIARDLRLASAAFATAAAGLSVIAAGTPGPNVTAAIAAERAAFGKLWSVALTADTQLRAARDLNLRQGMAHLDDGRAAVVTVDATALLAALVAAVVLGQRARRRERDERAKDERQAYETLFQQGLEMSRTESAVYAVVDGALGDAVPHLRVEMLVADSSRAHFRQTLNLDSDVEGTTGCGVGSPLDCPATIRGHTLVFPTSRGFSACPYLQGRPSGDCSAACVAISIGGKTVGVMHATGPDQVPPTPSDVGYLELTARRASERIGMIRAFEKSETQARTDPLTGLWNRRSLENRVHDLKRDGASYALAYGDLDHFKALNDTHGHEAGDQALRLFSRVLRDAVRPSDIAARYGGEEFVVVLPDCPLDTATGVLERIRERLALALTTGRVPAFTVSFGLASSADADTFDEVVAIADQALLDAKSAGRNRVVLAARPADPARTAPSA